RPLMTNRPPTTGQNRCRRRCAFSGACLRGTTWGCRCQRGCRLECARHRCRGGRWPESHPCQQDHHGDAHPAAAPDVLGAVTPDWGTPEERAKALPMVEAAYAAALARVPEGPAKAAGIVVGQGAGTSLVAH